MEKEFYIDYEGTAIIKAKNEDEARKKFWELEFIEESANVVFCGIEEKKPKKYLIDKKGLTK